MTREQLIEAFTMKIDGYSYQFIADKFGCTKQNIQDVFMRYIKNNNFKCAYPAIKKWMIENNVSLSEMYVLLGHNASNNTQYVRKKLSGKQNFNGEEIDKLIYITGIPYEQLFKKEYERKCKTC